ncbi:uncharacterized protein LOC115687722 isoform X2 [Syzygium oleosum]|uniref:uncharacterized protein LOC115687722 isoform X2 n=1 Tax=Syzygium oleosum TaxID=219896 RepID=UPI0011D1E9D1|nr:uncharacterized protein LOC115687722 isoform X2 [Syzygium oleosum]
MRRTSDNVRFERQCMVKEVDPMRRRHVSVQEILTCHVSCSPSFFSLSYQMELYIKWLLKVLFRRSRSQSYPFIEGEFDFDFHQRKMAYRAAGYWRSMLSRAGASHHRSFATATKPKMFAATANAAHANHHHERSLMMRGEYAPLGMVLAMVLVAMMMATHTAKQQLVHSPGVKVSKKKRETVPEVEDPDGVISSADKFLNKSFLRKVAHIQEDTRTIPDPVRANPYTKPREAETLKMAGVNPARH